MSIAVFGASGFLGKSITDGIAAEFHDILAIDKIYSCFKSQNIKFFKTPLGNSNTLPIEYLKTVNTFIYLVGNSTPESSNKDIPADIHDNVLAFIDFLELISTLNVEKVIFASSAGAIYSDENSLPYSEDCKLASLSAYGVGKIACEHYLQLYSKLHDFTAIILRLSNPYGPGQLSKSGFGVIPHIVHNLLNKKEISVYGKNESKRDFIFIDDVVRAFLCAIHYQGKNMVFNIGSGKSLAIVDLLKILERKLQIKAKMNFRPLRPTDKKEVVLNIQSAEKHLNWIPKTDIEDGLDRYIEWYIEKQTPLQPKIYST